MRRAVLALCAPLALSGCIAPGFNDPALDSGRLSARQDATAQLRGVMESWVAAHRAENAAAIAALYEENGTHSTSQTVTGRTQIEEMFEIWLTGSDDFRITDRRFTKQAGFGIETGIATQDIYEPNGDYFGTLQGDYGVLLALQPDGSWKIRHLVGGNAAYLPPAP